METVDYNQDHQGAFHLYVFKFFTMAFCDHFKSETLGG